MPSLLAGGEGTKCHASPHTRLPKGHGDPTGANAAETRSGEVGASSGASSQCHDVTPRVKLARFLSEAIADALEVGDVAAARIAHEALGRLLGPDAGDSGRDVVDIAHALDRKNRSG